GLAAPKGTPKAILDKLNAEFVKLFSEPKFLAFLDQQAVVSAPGTPAEFAAFLKEDRAQAEALIKLANTPRTDYKPEQQWADGPAWAGVRSSVESIVAARLI